MKLHRLRWPIAAVALVLTAAGCKTTGSVAEDAPSITLSMGEIVCDLNGIWGATYKLASGRMIDEEVLIEQDGASFLGIKTHGDEYVGIGEKTIKGILVNSGFSEAYAFHAFMGWMQMNTTLDSDCSEFALTYSDGTVLSFFRGDPKMKSTSIIRYEELMDRVKHGNAEDLTAEEQYEVSKFYSRSGETDEYEKWKCLAANSGHPESQYGRGVSYSLGSVTGNPDYVFAYMWYALAASSGHTLAAKFRDIRAEEMAPEEIAEAERLVAEWQPNPTECELNTAQTE